ncbi:hypothetical protein AB0F17_00080 [Nonomuraea sp. NPDC026600]|uniref:hypothetical protein n=1 Tax=Nonomuraea sp. NPDC026600 TaxID=3155363 RepID=UPI0033DAE7A1
MSNRSARGMSWAVIAVAVMMAPDLAGTSSPAAAAAADPTCGSWVSSLVIPGLSGRACIWGVGAGWKQAQTEVFNGTGSPLTVETLTAALDPLPGDARCTDIQLQNGQTAFCGTSSVPDNNPFEFDRAIGSAHVTAPGRQEQFSFGSPRVG